MLNEYLVESNTKEVTEGISRLNGSNILLNKFKKNEGIAGNKNTKHTTKRFTNELLTELLKIISKKFPQIKL